MIKIQVQVELRLKIKILENKGGSFKGDIYFGRYDDGGFNSDLDEINTYNRIMKLNKEDIFKVISQYNF